MDAAIELARVGKRVVYVLDSMDQARPLMIATATEHGNDIERVFRAAGRERILYRSGGVIDFVPYRSKYAHRGISADAVSLSTHAHADADYCADVQLCMAGSADAVTLVRPDATR